MLAHVKSSLGPRAATLAYTIEEVEAGGVKAARVLWATGRCDLTAEALMQPDVAALRQHSKTADAVAFLAVALAQGPRGYSELLKEAEAADISKNSMIRAGKKLGIVSTPDGFPRRTMWSLPENTDGTGTTGTDSNPSSPSSSSSPVLCNTRARERGAAHAAESNCSEACDPDKWEPVADASHNIVPDDQERF